MHTAIFHSISCPVYQIPTFETRENTAVSNAILRPAVCFNDVINKAGICGKISSMSRVNTVLFFVEDQDQD